LPHSSVGATLANAASFTIYFWAKALSVNGIRLAGIDGDNNICFAIDQEQTTLMRRDAVSAFLI
jgi:hypothetical protein